MRHSLALVSRNKPYLRMMATMDRLMTIVEVAAYMQVSRFTVYRLAREQGMPATKIGRQWRFQREEIDQWVRQQVPGQHR